MGSGKMALPRDDLKGFDLRLVKNVTFNQILGVDPQLA